MKSIVREHFMYITGQLVALLVLDHCVSVHFQKDVNVLHHCSHPGLSCEQHEKDTHTYVGVYLHACNTINL